MSVSAEAAAAVIVVQFGPYDELESCLTALAGSAAGSVIVVDNNCGEQYDADFYAHHPRARVIHPGENLGFAAGCNVGIQAFLDEEYEYFVVLNNDCRMTPEQVRALARVFKDDSSVGVAGPVVFNEPRKVYYLGGRIDFTRGKSQYNVAQQPPDDPELAEVDFVIGCGMMFSRVALQRAGLFDDDYFLYWEDTDISYRVRAAGYRTVIAPQIVVPHAISQTTGSGSPLVEYYMTRNGLRFFSRHAPTALSRFALPLRVSVSRIITGLRSMIRGEPEKGRARIQGVLDHFLNRSGHTQRFPH